MPEKAADSEESKGGSEERTGDERNRTESPCAKTEPSANPKELALKQSELSSSQNSPRSERRSRPVLPCVSLVTFFLTFIRLFLRLLPAVEPCKETGKSSEKGHTDSPLAKSEDKENKPGTPAAHGSVEQVLMVPPPSAPSAPVFTSDSFPVADDLRGDDALEGRLNGDKDALDEMDESRKEDKNGFRARFMFNIADGGFTGKRS